jgi:restriction endonuclease Mrr
VEVHLPILRDPSGKLGRTFDERLHDLVERKRALRTDFLRPAESEEAYASELLGTLLDDAAEGVAGAPVTPLKEAEIARLDPYQFEALVACLYDAQGYRTVLTPKAGDGGADVIAVRGGNWVLIQAKHSRSAHAQHEDVVTDTVAAGEIYTPQLGPGASLVVVTNTAFTGSATSAAHRCGVTLLTGRELADQVNRHGVTLGGVYARLGDRAESFGDVVRRVRAMRG